MHEVVMENLSQQHFTRQNNFPNMNTILLNRERQAQLHEYVKSWVFFTTEK